MTKRSILTLCIGLLLVPTLQAQTKSFKRGLSYNTLFPEDIDALSRGVSWVYNWAPDNNNATLTQYGIDFVPMAWSGLDKTRVRAYLKNHPEVKYILGFNEPNFRAQADLTPTQAAAKWPDIEEIADEFGLKIVSPAVNHSPDAPYQDPVKWMDEFFAACTHCRIDHIAVHFYMTTVSAIQSNIERFKKYGKPIWLTEFCILEGGTPASQRHFMVETLNYLETDPDIYRYAWFKDRYKGISMNVLDAFKEGVLTDLGTVFVNMSSYDDDFYFTTEQQIPSVHYIRMKDAHIEKTTDVSGIINLCDMNAPVSWIDYNVDIPEAGEYNIFFRLSAEYPDESEVYVSVEEKQITSLHFEKKGVNVWNTQSCKGTFSKGKQKIRIGFKQGGLRLNWWAISKNDQPPAALETIATENVAVYPNPVKDLLYLQTPDNRNEISLYDVSGKRIYFGKNVDRIDMSDFSQGMYLLNISAENGVRKVIKLLKENR